nr:DUF6261 family protein [uncultured Carboxylicivirga sp.]
MIESIKKSYLSAGETFTLASRCKEIITPEISTQLGLVEPVKTLDFAMGTLNTSMGNSSKSSFTEQLKDLDRLCDRSVMLLSNMAEAFTYSHVEEEAAAGKKILAIIRKHIPVLSDLGYVNQMARMKTLYSELISDTNKSALETLRLTAYVEQMSICRNNFEATYISKNQSEAETAPIIKTKEATAQTIAALEAMFSLINAHLLLTGGETIEKLVANLNQIIDSIHKAAK